MGDIQNHKEAIVYPRAETALLFHWGGEGMRRINRSCIHYKYQTSEKQNENRLTKPFYSHCQRKQVSLPRNKASIQYQYCVIWFCYAA